MEEYYARMSEDAEQREQRTNWRRRREEIRPKRIRFWREEKKRMEKMEAASTVR